MDTLRRFGLGISVLLFSVTTSLIAIFVGLYFVFESPQLLKQTLRESNIYSLSAADFSSGEASSSVPFTDPGLAQAFTSALSPAFVQNSSEQVIDSVYNWVQGTTSSQNFSISLVDVKNNFANNVAAYVRQKLDALPPCTQLVAPPNSLEELLDLTCRLQGITTTSIADKARQEVLSSQLLGESDVIDTATLKNKDGQPLSEQLSFVPTLHRYYLISFYALPILTLLLAIAIVCWSITKRVGIKRVAWLLISIGITNAVLSIAGVWFLHAAGSIFGAPTAGIRDKVLASADVFAVELRNWWLIVAGIYIVLGILLLVIVRLNRPKPTLVMGSGAPRQG